MRGILWVFSCCILAHNASVDGLRLSRDAWTVFAAPNEPAVVSCKVITKDPSNFAWTKEGNNRNERNVDDSTKKSMFWRNNKTHITMELYFTNVTTEDYGTYRCVVITSTSRTSIPVHLRRYPKDFTWIGTVHEPESVLVQWDFDLFYSSHVDSFGIEYRENGTNQRLRTPLLSTPTRIVSAGSYIINALKPNTVYEFRGLISDPRDLISDKDSYAFSRWVTTSDKVSERIVPDRNTVIVESHERAVLSCDVTGNQMTNFIWQHKGNSKKSTSIWWNNNTHVTMELDFASVTIDDSGDYICQANSSGHLVSAQIVFQVGEFHFAPFKVGAIGTDRIYISWNYTNIISDLFNYYNEYVELTIKYKEDSTNQWQGPGQIFNSSIDPAASNYVINELTNRTLYQIKIILDSYDRQFHGVVKSFVLSKRVTTFEKDLDYVPSVRIVRRIMDTITIQWSQPPPELLEYVDAYLISVEHGNKMERNFRWEKYKAADYDEADVYLSPSISHDLQVRACFDDYCPDKHASAVMKDVMTSDRDGRQHLRAEQHSESGMEFPVLEINVTRDEKDITTSSNASFTCSISVQGYEGWWTKKENHVKSLNYYNSEISWTINVEDAREGGRCVYTCEARMSDDLRTIGTMIVTLILPAENIIVNAEMVYARPHYPTALSCDFFGYRLWNFKWRKFWDYDRQKFDEIFSVLRLNDTHIRVMLSNPTHNVMLETGKYECEATNHRLDYIRGSIRLDVANESPLQLNAYTIGSKLVYLRWFDIEYRGDTHLVQSLKNGSHDWQDTFSVPVTGNKFYSGYVVRQLTRNASYWFQLVVISAGKRLASTYSSWITPTDEDIVYFPNITVTSKSTNSIAIEWPTPPEELGDHIKVYRISISYTYSGNETGYSRNTTQTHFVLGKLQPSTSHNLEVKACFSDVSTDCYSSDVRKGVFTNSIDGEKITPKETSGTLVETWVASTGSVLLLLIVLGVWQIYRKAKKRRIVRERLAYFYSEEPIFFNPELAISDQADLLPYNKKWEFPRKLLRLDEELGSGSFGIVWKARAKTIRRPEAISVVAVKTVRPTASLRCMKALLRELKILIYLGHHPNIVSLLGACTKNLDYGRLLVIVEFCRFGNLHDYLWRCRSKFVDELGTDSKEIPDSNPDADPINVETTRTNSALRYGDATSFVEDPCDSVDHPGTNMRMEDLATGSNLEPVEVKPPSKYPGDFTNAELDPVRTRDLVSWAWQISRGMQYLAGKKVLHGDLAARNVLLSEDNIVKICDFGLSKSLQEDDDYKDEGNDPLPVKWMAIESLRDGIFSVKSDVWSFGVVLWELFSLAKTPYPEINPQDMCETLVGGYRMERPKYSPETIYRTMLQCWEADPSKRPTFVELERSVGNLMEENVKMHYIQLYTRRERAYARITEFRNTQDSENQDPTLPDPIEPTNVNQGKRLLECSKKWIDSTMKTFSQGIYGRALFETIKRLREPHSGCGSSSSFAGGK
ncbi:uncharacterized protein LOC124411449 [Diprion similis]|uniref:uncharacterized protein LOC124411449 n=1 Tax=Diprion similis TaxID=362088 RepID=UPI001EF88AD9|nr:uncharacterized protein LOC124411449 [Diprion similis]